MLIESKIPADDVLFNELQVKYNQQFNLSWVGLYGFNNTYGLAVRKDLADKYNIHGFDASLCGDCAITALKIAKKMSENFNRI